MESPMGFIVFELCKGVRSELAIFPRKERAKEVVDLLYRHYTNDPVILNYEITDLYGKLHYSTKNAVTTALIAEGCITEAKLVGSD
jgi:hypothetical protein